MLLALALYASTAQANTPHCGLDLLYHNGRAHRLDRKGHATARRARGGWPGREREQEAREAMSEPTSTDAMAEWIVRDLIVGIADTGIRAGIIGEIASDFLPRLQSSGISTETIRVITVDNPRRALTGSK